MHKETHCDDQSQCNQHSHITSRELQHSESLQKMDQHKHMILAQIHLKRDISQQMYSFVVKQCCKAVCIHKQSDNCRVQNKDKGYLLIKAGSEK